MGIKDFYNMVKERAPEQLVEHSLSEFDGYRLAVDASAFLHAYVHAAGPIEWMTMFVQLVVTLKRHGIRLVFVFDGPHPPAEKAVERERRRGQLERSKARLAALKEIRVRLDEKPDNVAFSRKDIAETRDLLGLKPERDGLSWTSKDAVLTYVDEIIESLERQTLAITPEYGEKAQKLLTALGMPWFQADGEAEAICATLAVHKKVDAVVSEDTDVMAYGTPMMLSKFRVADGKVCVMQIEPMLSSLDMNMKSFRDLCILLGCDYNSRIKVWGKNGKAKPVGLKGALELIDEYETIDKFEHKIVDVDPLKYKRCRQLFTPPTECKPIPPLKKPNWDKVEKIFSRNSVRVSLDTVKQAWKPRAIVVREY
jgi:flap endonuclease-1